MSEPSVNKTDVLIVGAGPTGLLLANLLGTMGIETVIVDRNESTVTEPRAVSIDDESMRALQSAGLSNEVLKIVTRGYGSIYKGPNGKAFSEVKPTSKEFGFDKRNAFEQPKLEALLRRGLDRFNSVTPFFRTTLTGFKRKSGNVSVFLKPEEGEEYVIDTKYMIGCDGGQSKVRKDLEINMLGSTFKEPWLIVDLKTTKNKGFHTEVLCDPKRSCISLPGPDGIRRYEFKLHKHEREEDVIKEDYVRKLLASVGPDKNEKFRRVKVYTFHARLAETWRKGRVFLAGDAAHLTPPFAGQGMNSGLRDSHNLAWKIFEALRKKNIPTRFLDSYEDERKPHAQAMIDLALRMGKIMMPTSKLNGALVRQAFKTLSIYPPARDYIVQMRYKPKPRFRKGLVWPDLCKPSIVGQMFPQPIVETISRERTHLDNLLDNKLVVLIFSEKPEQAISVSDYQKLRDGDLLVVGLTPEWINPGNGCWPIVRDVNGILSNKPFNRYLERALLLRRDRYVGASTEIGNIRELIPMALSLQAVAD
ncbi:MAG: bifunctional 3-(3-hydroxy-phenyl)propionate/3-hydroxycinnamic acid hydroxylase [Paracoccaceae bacterium]